MKKSLHRQLLTDEPEVHRHCRHHIYEKTIKKEEYVEHTKKKLHTKKVQ